MSLVNHIKISIEYAWSETKQISKFFELDETILYGSYISTINPKTLPHPINTGYLFPVSLKLQFTAFTSLELHWVVTFGQIYVSIISGVNYVSFHSNQT